MITHSTPAARLMLATAASALIASVIWALSPPRPVEPVSAITPDAAIGTTPAATDTQPAPLPDFRGMELWTKPPPVVAPAPPPPPLRLNAELLAIRRAGADADAIATLYLIDSAEIVRLKQGDQLGAMTVDRITESSIRFVKGDQSLTISRDAG